MAKTIATVLGIVFLLVGVIGFVAPTILNLHLTMMHTVVHLLTGAVSLFLGLKGSLSAARTFGIVFGSFYLLLGLAGFVAGSGEDRMLTIIPDQLMLGTMDHIVHILLGAVFLIGGLMTRSAVVATTPPARA